MSRTQLLSGNDRWRNRYVCALIAGDAAAATLGALAAQAVRFQGTTEQVTGSSVSYQTVSLIIMAPWVITMALGGVYERRRLGNGSDEYRRILNAAVRFLAAVAITSLFFQLAPARGIVVLALPLATVLTVGSHYLGRRWLHRQRSLGQCAHRVLVVGAERQVVDLVRHFRSATYAGFGVVGACIPGWTRELDIDGEVVRVAGPPDRVLQALHDVGADTVAVADHEALSNGALRRLSRQLEGTGADLLVAPSVIEVAGPRISIRPVAGLPLLHVEEPQLAGFSRVVKSGTERFAAAVLLMLLSPVFAAIALVIRVTSRGPALFRQTRVGQGGRTFTLYKFRTMRVSAEAELIGMADTDQSDGPLYKHRTDPRRTGVGRTLRRYSIDELPQLWNVVTGHMSIIGPRPPLPQEVAVYTEEVRRRLLVKPGMTGLWQVSGRSDLPWSEATRLDLYYVENWSLALDLVILAKTATAVLRGTGAY